MKCFVAGACGFIGSYVVKSLAEQGHQVVAFDVIKGSRWIDELLSEEEKTRVTFITGDITDKDNLRRRIVEESCDSVAHLAGRLNQKTRSAPVEGVRLNVVAFQNLLEICKEEKIKKVVWASSSAVLGTGPDRRERFGSLDPEYTDEKTAVCPESLYSWCKTFNEGISNFYRKEYEMDVVGLRVNLSYGPYIKTSFEPFFSSFIDIPALGNATDIPYGDTLFDFQYVKDMADMFRAVLLAPKTKSGIFVTRGDLRPVKDAAEFLKKLFPESKITVSPGMIDLPWKFDASRLEAETGYQLGHTMEQGLLKSINTVRKSNGLEPVGIGR